VELCRTIQEMIEQEIEAPVYGWIKQVDQFCEDLPWPLDWFCHTVTSFFWGLIKAAITALVAVTRTVCEVVSLFGNLAGWLVGLVESLPLVGAAVRWIVGGYGWAVSTVFGGLDGLGRLVGIKPVKHVRLEVIILRDTNGAALLEEADLATALSDAATTLFDRAQIRLHANVQTATNPAATVALTVDTNSGLFGEDLTLAGGYFQMLTNQMLFDTAFFRALRVFDPIVCFVVRGVGGTELGCSGGPLMDYICMEGPTLNAGDANGSYDPTSLPHEVCHGLGLWHDSITNETQGDPTNLMFAFSSPGQLRGTNLSGLQASLVRGSSHVSPV
jgi:hypothetical protein